MFTSDEIRKIGFQKAGFNGYKVSDVNDFLNAIADDFETLENNNQDLITKIQVLADHIERYRGNEDAVKEAIINAQITADSVLRDAEDKSSKSLSQANEQARLIIEEATTKADLLTSQAQKEAKEITDVANAKADDIVSSAESKAIQLKNEADKRVEIQKEVYKKLKSIIGSYREDLISDFKKHIEMLYIVSDSEKFLNEAISKDTTDEEFNEKLVEKEFSKEKTAFEKEDNSLKLADFDDVSDTELQDIETDFTIE